MYLISRLVITLICSHFFPVLATPNFEVSVLTSFIRCNDPYAACNLNISRNQLFVDAVVLKNIPRVTFEVQLAIRPSFRREYTTLSKNVVDFCSFAFNPIEEPMVGLLWDMLARNKQNYLPKQCPLKAVIIF